MNSNKQILHEYLKSQRLMSVASYNNKKPWTCSLYYTIDNSFNLYFLSEPHSQHCKELASNPNVAVNIADSNQKVTDKKIGAQIQGNAQQLTSVNQIKKVLNAWNNNNPGFDHIINWDNILNNKIKSKVYKITPKLIKFLNEELYGPEGTEVFSF